MKIEEGKYYRNRNGLKVGPTKYTRDGDEGGFYISGYGLIKPDGCFGYGTHSWHESLDLIAEWTDEPETPKLWRNMTPEEKGALLLAKFEGKAIEWIAPWYADDKWDQRSIRYWLGNMAYRVRPEPERETESVTIVNADGMVIGRGTVITENGTPDVASIRMEPLK